LGINKFISTIKANAKEKTTNNFNARFFMDFCLLIYARRLNLAKLAGVEKNYFGVGQSAQIVELAHPVSRQVHMAVPPQLALWH
jgi:hypothetical protein